jgi:hypothetical protein
LKVYDLPDLLAAMAPRPLWIIDAVDPVGQRLGVEDIRRDYARSLEAYEAAGAPTAIHITTRKPDEDFKEVYHEAR